MPFAMSGVKIIQPSTSGRGPGLVSYETSADSVAAIRGGAYFYDHSGPTDDQRQFLELWKRMNKPIIMARSVHTAALGSGSGAAFLLLEQDAGSDLDTVRYKAGT